MKKVKMIFFIILTVISQCTSNEVNSEPEEFSQFTESNNNQNEKCVCYNITGETVTDKLKSLSPGTTTIERFVVYIYRDSSTDKRYMYIPKKEKQYSLPELTFDVEDDIIPISDTNQVINNITKVILSINEPHTDIHEYDRDSQQKYEGETNGHQEQTDTDTDDVNDNPNKPDLDYSKILYPSINDEQDKDTNTDFDSQNLPQPFLPSAKDVIQSSPQTFVTNVMPKINDSAFVHIAQEEQEVRHLDSDLKPAEVNVTNVDEAREDVAKGTDSESKIINNIISPFGNYVTFDKWFDQQIHRINKTQQKINKNIDVPSLKVLIEKALYENHMYITNDGVLIDSHGKALNVANIKLRPILIGTSMPYNILLSVKDNKLELPSDVPYLEAVLVTVKNPPKVLGVIPLGKTYIPPISFRQGFAFSSPKSSLSFCATDKCNSRDPLFVVGNGLSHGYHKRPPYYSNVHKLMIGQPKHRGGSLRKQIVFKFDYANKRPLDLLQSLFSLKVNQSPRSKFADTLDKYLSKEYDYEIPGFRIIGGSAATGSGTPVSSRGRSGLLLDK